jgi:hypothetical protein
MLRRAALVTTDVPEEYFTSIIGVKRISLLVITLAVISELEI